MAQELQKSYCVAEKTINELEAAMTEEASSCEEDETCRGLRIADY